MGINLFDMFPVKPKTALMDKDKTLLKIDCVPSENHTMTSECTAHPVEDGTVITDHIIKKGKTLQLNGIISDDPITLAGTLIGGATGIIGGLVGGKSGKFATAALGKIGNTLLNKSTGKPSKTARDILEQIYETGTLCTIITGLMTYTDMAMVNVSCNRSAKTARALEFSAQFQQIQIAISETVTMPKSNNMDASKNLGKMSSAPASDAVTSKGTGASGSILYNAVGLFQ